MAKSPAVLASELKAEMIRASAPVRTKKERSGTKPTPEEMEAKAYYTTDEIIAMFEINITTLANWIRRGKIPEPDGFLTRADRGIEGAGPPCRYWSLKNIEDWMMD